MYQLIIKLNGIKLDLFVYLISSYLSFSSYPMNEYISESLMIFFLKIASHNRLLQALKKSDDNVSWIGGLQSDSYIQIL